MDRPRARRALVASAFVAAAAFVLFLGSPVCPTALVFGIPCPGCGLTRATLAVLRGDVALALRLHPLVFVLAPLLALALASALVEFVQGGAQASASKLSAWLSSRTGYAVAGALLAVTLFVWGARFFDWFGGPAPVESLRDLLLNRSR